MKFVSLMLKKAQMVSLETEESVREVQAISQVHPGPVDSCPACGTGIGFDDIMLAKCESGHYWSEHP
jgi:Putative zinc-finger of transcription factor IIIC complex